MGIKTKKTAIDVFLIALLLTAFSLLGSLQVGIAQTSTKVAGIISKDTTWSKANSPYNLIEKLLIDSGVTVTVQSGAVVNLNGYDLRVNGSLIIQPGATVNMGTLETSTSITTGTIVVNGVFSAKGRSDNPIHVNGATYYWKGSSFAPSGVSGIRFTSSSSAWNEQTGSGCIIENIALTKSTYPFGIPFGLLITG